MQHIHNLDIFFRNFYIKHNTQIVKKKTQTILYDGDKYTWELIWINIAAWVHFIEACNYALHVIYE